MTRKDRPVKNKRPATKATITEFYLRLVGQISYSSTTLILHDILSRLWTIYFFNNFYFLIFEISSPSFQIWLYSYQTVHWILWQFHTWKMIQMMPTPLVFNANYTYSLYLSSVRRKLLSSFIFKISTSRTPHRPWNIDRVYLTFCGRVVWPLISRIPWTSYFHWSLLLHSNQETL